MKTCRICQTEKPLSEYHKKAKNRDGLDNMCKSCKAAYHKERYKDLRVKELGRIASRKHSMKKIGIEQEQIDKFYEVQARRCAICFITEEEHGKLLALDHNHANGKARGLLCQQCNTGLGNFRDNIGLLTMAIAYLSVTP